MSNIWGGRFSEEPDQLVQKFTQSISYDQRLFKHDIQGSIAHATALLKAGILKKKEAQAIVQGLKQIETEIASGNFEFKEEYEDIHMNIEAALTKKIGAPAKKLHTGRSRNDQVATDLRLYLMAEIDNVSTDLSNLCRTLLKRAEEHKRTIMPGYTHLQIAQPVLLAHHLLAYVEMFLRDRDRLSDCRIRTAVMPLGSAALAGTAYPLDRDMIAKDLGFKALSENSMDAVSDRDFVIEFAAAAALIAVHLSRLAEDVIIWNTAEFKFVELADAFATGSSIMPQKKNPDIAELIRGKSGRVCGNLTALLMLLKGLPMTYNRDLQEDKEQLFDTIDTVSTSLQLMSGLFQTVSFNRETMQQAARKGFSNATDLADYLARKGVPFREAHEITGKLVKYGIDHRLALEDIPQNIYRQHNSLIENDIYNSISLEASINARNIYGGTAPAQVVAALRRAKKRVGDK